MTSHSTRRLVRLLGFVALLLALLGASTAQAADPVVHAVLFYSPTCPHCHIVMEQVLPPLQARYGAQLRILTVDVSQPAGQALYQTALTTFAVPQDRLGVPALFVGSELMVGSAEIPARLPALIVSTLQSGGNDWPAIAGLAPWLNAGASPDAPTLSPFQRDPLANGMALALLLVMIGSVVALLLTLRPPFDHAMPTWRARAIPILSIAGAGVALYLAVVELSGAPAVCGPVGDCNTVQQSPYARLFGVLPIGVLGVVGYIAILAAWALRRAGGNVADIAAKTLPILAFLGTIFSIYLTFLEPFVIGATCMWCLTSAALMTALLWLTVPRRAPEVRRGKALRR
ncbi:MAG: vitamin K epoxide reductase family protein [Chloroflexales bacterium]